MATLLQPQTFVKYTLDDFERIKHNGFSCPLQPETLAIIQSLADQVGAPEYIRTPQFIKREVPPGHYGTGTNAAAAGQKKRRGGNKANEINDEDWETVRNFKATLLAKKDGMAAINDQIRKHLNKMTTTTYAALKVSIFQEIELITEGIIDKGASSMASLEDEDFVNEINKIGEAIFTIASGNSFYSPMYAKLYKELMDKFAFMKTIFETNFKKFNTLFNDFTYCDPNKDYDQYCQINKTNEKRRALSLFYVNLMKERAIDCSELMKILLQLQTKMGSAIKETEQKNIVDEMAEIVFILITNGYDMMKTHTEWAEVDEFVNTVTGYKPTSFPSITHKTIFKFMDILDVL